MSKSNPKIVQFTLRLKVPTHAKMKRVAKDEGRSLNKQIEYVCDNVKENKGE